MSNISANSPIAGAVQSRDLPESWFRVPPSRETIPAVAKAARVFWRDNAIEVLEAAAAGLGRDLGPLIDRVRAVDLGRRLSPRLSSRLTGLMDAVGRRDGYAAIDRLQSWWGDAPETWYDDELSVDSIALHDWEGPVLHEVRATKIEGAGALEFFPTLGRDLGPSRAAVRRALELIAGVDADMAAEIGAQVSHVKLFEGRGMEGLSSPKAFGAIWVRVPEPEQALGWFLEHLVHECSHLHLNALLALDPLLTNPAEINQAPIRPDPRPMFQILHGTFVLARNVRVHSRLHAAHPELGLGPALEKFREQYAKGIAVIRAHLKPTARGALLMASFPEPGVEDAGTSAPKKPARPAPRGKRRG
jgi:hypothetical protein